MVGFYTGSMLKAIVFDFDGVIVDSEPMHYQAFAAVAGDLGIQFTYADYAAQYIGFDDRDAFAAMLKIHLDATSDRPPLEQLIRRKAEHFETLVAKGTSVYPATVKLILAAAGKLPLAIASGAGRRDIDLILEPLRLRDPFDVIVSADDVRRSKPDPETYVRAVHELAGLHRGLDLAPADCLAIEDTTSGIDAALEAGLWTLAVAHTTAAEHLGAAHRVVQNLDGLTLQTLRYWHES